MAVTKKRDCFDRGKGTVAREKVEANETTDREYVDDNDPQDDRQLLLNGNITKTLHSYLFYFISFIYFIFRTVEDDSLYPWSCVCVVWCASVVRAETDRIILD